jgi:hypothetical protein
MVTFPALLLAQASPAAIPAVPPAASPAAIPAAPPAENGQGLDYGGKAIVALLPLAGNETEMIRRFQGGIMEAVAALQKYNPREVRLAAVTGAGLEIPTDMPPVQSLAIGARYALTGGVYPGNRAGEYFLQLWLWDMAGSTMIYTDDLVYDDMDGAMESLPGLVEWLFSHIREVIIEEPKADLWPDPLFMLGLRFGISPRWYVGPGEVSPGAWATNLEGGISGALRLNSLFSLQLELLLTADTLIYRGLEKDFLENEKFSSLSMTIPLVCKINLRAGPVRLSPLAGLYLTAPLGETRYHYHYNTGKGDKSYSWSWSVPMGFTAGIEGAVRAGPGRVFAGMRYAGDFSKITINDDPQFRKHSYANNNDRTNYQRYSFSLYFGYEFGFLDGKKIGEFLGDLL